MAEVNVRGLRELAGAFRQVERGLPKELQQGLKRVADHVIGRVQQRMPLISGEAATSLKPRATQRGAGIAYPGGGTPWRGVKADYYPWLDFGGSVGRGHKTKRPVIRGGRYLYPTIADSREFIGDEVDGVIEHLARQADFTTTGHV